MKGSKIKSVAGQAARTAFAKSVTGAKSLAVTAFAEIVFGTDRKRVRRITKGRRK